MFVAGAAHLSGRGRRRPERFGRRYRPKGRPSRGAAIQEVISASSAHTPGRPPGFCVARCASVHDCRSHLAAPASRRRRRHRGTSRPEPAQQAWSCGRKSAERQALSSPGPRHRQGCLLSVSVRGWQYESIGASIENRVPARRSASSMAPLQGSGFGGSRSVSGVRGASPSPANDWPDRRARPPTQIGNLVRYQIRHLRQIPNTLNPSRTVRAARGVARLQDQATPDCFQVRKIHVAGSWPGSGCGCRGRLRVGRSRGWVWCRGGRPPCSVRVQSSHHISSAGHARIGGPRDLVRPRAIRGRGEGLFIARCDLHQVCAR